MRDYVILGKFFFLVLFSITANNIVYAQDQESDKNSLEKGQLIEVPAYFGAEANFEARLYKSILSTTLYQQDFESDSVQWSMDGVWEIGSPLSGPNSGYNSSNAAGTNLAGDYANSIADTLISPVINLTAGTDEDVFLEFYEWFRLESGFDKGYVIISDNNGESWTTLHERSGQTEWVLNRISLNNYRNEQVRIGFVITTDESFQFDGWFLDDVAVKVRPKDELTTKITSINTQGFPFVYMNVTVDTFGVGLPSLDAQDFMVTENGVLQEDFFQVTPPEQSGQVRLADIVFIMDNSGSMSQEQASVSDNVFAFVDSLNASGINFSLGLTRYGASQFRGDPIFENSGSLTQDAEFFKDEVWTKNVLNGGLEPGYKSLIQTINGFNFRPGAQKVFIIITDETPNQSSFTVNDAQSALQENSVTVFALTESSHFDDFEPLVEDPDEQIFNIYEPFEGILDFIVETVSGSYVVSYRSTEQQKDGVTRRVQVKTSYDGIESLDNTSYVPGSTPEVKRTITTVDYSSQAWAEGTPFNIQVEVRDEVAPFVQSATLYYRTTGTSEYTSVSMQALGGDLFEATIEEGIAERPGLDYYITSTDGNSSASTPRVNPADNPYQIPILPNKAPEISHEPVVNTGEGSDVLIEAEVTDNTNELAEVRLFYRQLGQLVYTSKTMNEAGADEFQGTIPGDVVTSAGVEYYIEAEDDLGLKNWAPSDRDSPAFISTGEIIQIDLNALSDGPRPADIIIPNNGKGYLYYQISSTEGDIFHANDFVLGASNDATDKFFELTARFLADNLIQIEIPYGVIINNAATYLQLDNEFNIGETTYSMDRQEGAFSVIPQNQQFSRTWSVFASGSVGAFAAAGVGAGVSVAAAKASIGGVGGVGLDIQANQSGELSITRKMNAGVAAALSVPAVEPVIGSITPGAQAGLTVKALSGQTINFARIASADARKRLQAGYVLETISLGGVAISPTVALFLNATTQSINRLGGVSNLVGQALEQRYGGIGLEGTISTGLTYSFGPIEMTSAGAAQNFRLQAKYYQFPLGMPENENTTTGLEFTSATSYDLDALSWDLGFTDFSSFTAGSGSEISMAGYWNENGSLDFLRFSLTNGGDITVNDSNLESYQTSSVDIPVEYVSALSGSGSALATIVSRNNISFGGDVASKLNNDFRSLLPGIQNTAPIVIKNSEKRGIGTDYNFKASFGAGAGLDVGLNLKLYDEVAFPKSTIQVYDEGQNYLVNSSNYSQSMRSQELGEVLDDLFSGTYPLIEEAWNSLINSVSEAITGGVGFVYDFANGTSEFVGRLGGVLIEDGDLRADIYSPRSTRIVQKGFEKPEIVNRYSSPNVKYPVQGKITDESGNALKAIEAGSELIVISDVINLKFIPDGASSPVDVLADTLELEMQIRTDDLNDNGFTVEDTSEVKIYRYDLDTNSWILVGGVLDGFIRKAQVTELGEYALGIEINRDNDTKKPVIGNHGYIPANAENNRRQMFAIVRDDLYGSGIDFSQTYMFLNDDTLNYVYQPAQNRIFYTLSDTDNLRGGTEIGRVELTDNNGNTAVKSFTFRTTLVSTGIEEEATPNRFELLDNYPNPFNPQTNIPFNLAEATHVEINIYDVLGRFVETLVDQRMEAGRHTVSWSFNSAESRGLSTGIYFYQIKAGNFNQVKKMTLIK